jgi:hypothetical protein
MSAPEQKDPETKDIEYNEEQKKILENIEKQIGKIKEIENITIGENESLVNIKEHLEPIPERIRKLRNELLEKLDALKKELKRLQDEAANDNSLKDITEMIKTSIKEIDNLTEETGSLTETKEKINQAIEDKIKEARDKELEGKDKDTNDSAKENDEIAFKTDDDNKLQQIWDDLVTKAKQDKEDLDNIGNELQADDQEIPYIYQNGIDDIDTWQIVNRISSLIKKQTPLIYAKMKENIKEKYLNDPKDITLAEIETLYKKSNTEVLANAELKDIFKGESDEVREVVNKVSRQFETTPGLYNTFKEELIKEYNKQKPKGKLNKQDIDKLINQGVIPTLVKNGVPVLDKDGNRIPIEGESPMKGINLSKLPQGQERIKNISKRSQDARETRKQLPKRGGKRTRKRRNSRKKKVVKRR